MGYTIAGTYLADCSCEAICGCPVDAVPDNGECRGAAVFHVERGNLDDVDLSGVNWAMCNYFPSNITSGNWRVGIVVDAGATDEQAAAIEKIASGTVGGPFEAFAPLIADYVGMSRGKVTFADGDKPSASVEGVGDLAFQPFIGPDGGPTTVKNAMFGFAPEFRAGRSGTTVQIFDTSVETKWAESAAYEYSSEAPDAVHPRA